MGTASNDHDSGGIARRLSALLSADVKDYSRLMGDDDVATMRTLGRYREVFSAAIAAHHGRVVDAPGDNLLAEFASAIDAVACAVAVQAELASHNQALPAPRRMHFRIGINIGDILVEGERIFGDGVNIAARIESLAEAGGVCVSGMVFDQVEGKLDLGFRALGEQTFKNIAKPVRVYAVVDAAAEASWSDAASDSNAPLELPDKPSIAVLPFVNRSQDAEQEYFSDGMTEDLITDLSKVSGLFVISRNSVFGYKGVNVRAEQIAAELGVRYLLEGSVRKAGTRVRISAQLSEARTGHSLWAERYDRELDDIFALQDEVIQQIVRALSVTLSAGERARIAAPPTASIEAYDAFVRGREEYARRERNANAEARRLFERAIELDPHYAEAFAFLGRTYMTAMINQWSADEDRIDKVFDYGERAVAIDPGLPTAHETLAYGWLARRDHDAALRSARTALEYDPNFADAYITLAEILTFAGQPESAIPAIEKALRLNPHYTPNYLWSLGHAHMELDRYAEAVAIFRRAVTRNPDHFVSWLMLAACYVALDDMPQARAAAAEVMRISPNYSVDIGEARSPGINPVRAHRMYENLRRAGVPS